MTTNSPNPVDGDVQALIEHIEKRKSGETRNDSVSDFNKFQRKIYEIALAALTAEPADRIVDDGCSQRIGCVQVSDKLNCTWPLGTQFYTTPPAKLLRPVELPDCVDDLHGVGPVMSADAVVEALRQQGYEVKND